MYTERIARIGATFAIALGALALASCGGGDNDKAAAPTSPPAVVSPVAEDETPRSSTQTIDVDQTFWHAGWKVTLGEATFTGGASPVVEVAAVFENLGIETASFNSQLVLTAAGETFTEPTFDQDFPQVPGELSGNGLITFIVNDDFAFDDATLIVGNAANNQATVPIGPDGDDLIDLAPRELPITGSAIAGAVTLTVASVEVRTDLPDQHSITEDGKTLVIVHFNATVSSGIPIGEGVLQSGNVALKLPDGTAVAVRTDGTSGVNELLQGREGTTIQDLSVRFEVPSPPEGDYAFVVRGRYAAGTDQVEGELAFTIPPEGAAAGTPESSSTPAASSTAAASPAP